MPTYTENLSKMLRNIRHLCGYSQEAVASALNVTRSTYTYYELGRVQPDLDTVKKLAAIYQIPPESFLYPEEFVDLETARHRAPKNPAQEPQTIGQLSAEEKALIAAFRIGLNGS